VNVLNYYVRTISNALVSASFWKRHKLDKAFNRTERFVPKPFSEIKIILVAPIKETIKRDNNITLFQSKARGDDRQSTQ